MKRRTKFIFAGWAIVVAAAVVIAVAPETERQKAEREAEEVEREAVAAANQAHNDDVMKTLAWLRGVGDILMNEGIVTEHDRSGWSSQADYTIGSLLPGEAREVARLICDEGGGLMASGDMPGELSAWTVRVFLPTGERPAASCRPGR